MQYCSKQNNRTIPVRKFSSSFQAISIYLSWILGRGSSIKALSSFRLAGTFYCGRLSQQPSMDSLVVGVRGWYNQRMCSLVTICEGIKAREQRHSLATGGRQNSSAGSGRQGRRHWQTLALQDLTYCRKGALFTPGKDICLVLTDTLTSISKAQMHLKPIKKPSQFPQLATRQNYSTALKG